jgi:hypothetical protein
MGRSALLSSTSRRQVLWAGLTALVSTAAWPSRARGQQKAAKKLVQYQETPKGNQQCDRCLHFVPPDTCKLVEGKINPKGWCALFAPKPK